MPVHGYRSVRVYASSWEAPVPTRGPVPLAVTWWAPSVPVHAYRSVRVYARAEGPTYTHCRCPTEQDVRMNPFSPLLQDCSDTLGSHGWEEACAAAHNALTHAMNGNTPPAPPPPKPADGKRRRKSAREGEGTLEWTVTKQPRSGKRPTCPRCQNLIEADEHRATPTRQQAGRYIHFDCLPTKVAITELVLTPGAGVLAEKLEALKGAIPKLPTLGDPGEDELC